MFAPALLFDAIATVPAGRWGVAVSGGADSVALLRVVRERLDLSPVVVHLDHETRAGQSTSDAAFVADLAEQLAVPLVLATRSQIEPQLHDPPRNRSARFRAVRHALFRQAVASHDLLGVLLAHHADDQAETILHRLLRSATPSGVTGMVPLARLGGVELRRPLLVVGRPQLRDYLSHIGQSWREDASNNSPAYTRNRLRRLLHRRPSLVPPLLELADAMRTLRDWTHAAAPVLPPSFSSQDLDGTAPFLANDGLRRWLADAGCPSDDVSPAVIARLFTMLTDAASPPRAHFPGGVLVTRRRGRLSASHPARG